MHGQTKQVSSYAGDYGGGVASNRLVSYTKKEFYDVGEPVNMVGFDNTSKSFVFEKYVPGSEELVSMEARKVYEFRIRYQHHVGQSNFYKSGF